MRSRLALAVMFGVATTATFGAQRALAQYPKPSQDVIREAETRRAAADKHSDEMFDKALPVIQEWEKKGKPYIPWARKPSDLPQAGIRAFPGAEGGGAWSFGGRGGKVYVVTSLDDSGPGTFREALEAAGPRIVVFNVSGIIKLNSRIRIRAPYITIAGNTAPGDGVCIAGDTVELETHDVIIRHMRFRRGNTWVGDRNDSLGGNPVGNIMVDHVSGSWGLDEVMSMYRHIWRPPGTRLELKLPTVNITFQNCIFAEGLNTYHHAFGSTIGGFNSTFMRNLWSSNTGRNPSVGMNGDFAFVNNVLFNWRHRTIDGGDDLSYFNIINNYFKPGPATPVGQPISYRILKPEAHRGKDKPDAFGKAYVNGNIVEGNEAITADNWAGGVQLGDASDKGTNMPRDVKLREIRVDSPFPMAAVTILPARDAYDFVLANAGATLPRRDPIDLRILNTVRTGQIIARPDDTTLDELSHAGYSSESVGEIMSLIPKGIITNPKQVGGYPEYKGTPYKDSDSDGMPDDWESRYGLNPNDASDATADVNGDGYTNIEKYIYGLDPTKKIDWSDPKNNIDPLASAKLQASS